MVSTFFGLNISLRALMTAQRGLEVTAHNIANANTPGYSRQRAELSASNPIMYPGMNRPGVVLQMGTGVNVTSVKRIRDEFLDHIIRQSSSEGGWFAAKQTGFSQIETILNEPSETGLTGVLADFFASFDELSNAPELASVRANVREKGINLSEALRQFDRSLKTLRTDQNRQIVADVNKINNLLEQVANINAQIGTVQRTGDDANDLKDARDLLIDELSSLINIETRETESGAVQIFINGMNVVDKTEVVKLEARTSSGANKGDVEVVFANGVKPRITSGEIKGLIETRDIVIPSQLERLNRFTAALVNRVNYQHKLGYGLDGQSGRAFFNDYKTQTLVGTIDLGSDVSLETTIDKLGITAGNFTVDGIEIKITSDDIKPGEAISLGDLIERINQSQPFVRASLVSDHTGNRVVFDLYNPPDVNYTITTFKGSSNFLDSVTGITQGSLTRCKDADIYTNAMDMIDVSQSIKDNLNHIAAAGEIDSQIFDNQSGNNKNALKIAELLDRDDIIDRSSLSEFYTGIISTLGAESQTNGRLTLNQGLLADQLENQRQSISGVSIDEESMNMVQFQRAFEGAARVTQVLDSMIETIIFDLGLT